MDDLLQKYTDKITSEFPEVTYTSARVITHGWDNHVVILDDAFVFRFPKTDEYKTRFKSEIALLKYLKDKVAVAIPDYKYISTDESFGGYPIISGTELRIELFQSQTEVVKDQIISDLADFLTILHQTPKEKVEEIGIDTSGNYYWNPGQVQDMYTRIKEKVYPLLIEEEVAWIEFQFTQYLSLKGDIKLVLIHSDLNNDHIFFDVQKGKISGIIDFADAEYGDSSLDFSRLLDYGEDFMRKIVDKYQGFKDESLIQRAKFRRLTGMVGNMLVITEGKKMQTSFEDQRLQLNKRMKLFPKSKF
jgi:aminoglycoside 2''-phosphotransferase